MHKRLTMKIDFTDEQRAALEPLFAKVREQNQAGAPELAIFAQVWPDGCVAMTANPEEVAAIRAALRHTGTGTRYSADHWVEESQAA